MNNRENKTSVHGIFLAAGKSRRMGFNKLELPFGNTSVGSYTLMTYLHSNLDHIQVVIGRGDAPVWMNTSLFSKPLDEKWSRVSCVDSALGQAYSIKCGLQEAMLKNSDAIMILLADQPLISTEMINRLIEEFYKIQDYKDDYHLIASSYHEILRPPILFTKKAYPYLQKLEGDQGARLLIRKNKDLIGLNVQFENQDWFEDIDTWEDYRRLIKKVR
ncbi:NTP transferase domain-containing protein [Tepidibacillus marianensis]|uniref:NTP transferase domain-containing protein n=1 Tax=Tepidibacillus marianensis TaxID=3131995 RepID=UPI0030CD8253